MDPRLQLPNAAAVICLLVLTLVPPAEAYDAGDALALLLGSVLAVVGFCACLGWYARRRNGQLWRGRGAAPSRSGHHPASLLPGVVLLHWTLWHKVCVRAGNNKRALLGLMRQAGGETTWMEEEEEGERNIQEVRNQELLLILCTAEIKALKTLLPSIWKEKDCCSSYIFPWGCFEYTREVTTAISWCVCVCSVQHNIVIVWSTTSHVLLHDSSGVAVAFLCSWNLFFSCEE